MGRGGEGRGGELLLARWGEGGRGGGGGGVDVCMYGLKYVRSTGGCVVLGLSLGLALGLGLGLGLGLSLGLGGYSRVKTRYNTIQHNA